MSDHKGAALIYPMLPDAETIIADKGYDSDAFRDALAGRGITPCIPPRAKRRLPATYCKTLYRQRHKVENMFAKLKDWPYLKALRPLRPHILQRYLHRGNCYLSARSMGPDARSQASFAAPNRKGSVRCHLAWSRDTHSINTVAHLVYDSVVRWLSSNR